MPKYCDCGYPLPCPVHGDSSLQIKRNKGMEVICGTCGEKFEVLVYQEKCPQCTIKATKALAKLHGMVFREVNNG